MHRLLWLPSLPLWLDRLEQATLAVAWAFLDVLVVHLMVLALADDAL